MALSGVIQSTKVLEMQRMSNLLFQDLSQRISFARVFLIRYCTALALNNSRLASRL